LIAYGNICVEMDGLCQITNKANGRGMFIVL